MKVILIRQERVLVLTQAMQDHTDHVQQRNQHRRESDHHVRVGQCRRDLVRHAHVNDQETDHVAQRKAAGIPHEKLMSTVGVTEHVVAPKGHKDTQRTDRQQGVNILSTKKEYNAQTDKAIQHRPEAKPSIPSIKLMAFVIYTTINTVNGTPTQTGTE